MPIRTKKIYLISLLLSVFIVFNLTKNSFAYNLEIISLQHRPANEIIPVLKPLLIKDGSISGENFTIFIQTSDDNLQQLKSLLPVLDIQYRLLRISMMQETPQMMKRYGYLVDDKNKKSNTMIYSTQRKQNNPNQQIIQVTEGQWATLQTGTSIPSLSRTTNHDGTVTESIQYSTVLTRLKIHPVIKGKKLNIEIQSQTGNNNNIQDMPVIKSRVSGELGEWIALGGIVSKQTKTASRYSFTTQRSSNTAQQLFIKIELTTYQD